MIKTSFKQVELISCIANVGYVKGNNMALRELGFGGARAGAPVVPQVVWLLNADTVVQPGCLAKLLDFMQSHPLCGLCTPQLLNNDGTLQHGSFRFPGLVQLLIDTQPRLARLTNTVLDGRYSPATYQSGIPFQVGHPLGAGMMASAGAIRAVGLLDEGYEMYCEEVDWAMRMARAGWQRWCVPAALLTHIGGASSQQAATRARKLLWASRRRFYATYFNWPKRAIAMKIAAMQT